MTKHHAISRVEAGRKAQSRGKRWENRIETACRYYQAIGLARIAHYGPPSETTKDKRGRSRTFLVRGGEGPPDYVGLLCDAGIFVAFEAKATGSVDKWTTDKRVHQYFSLVEMRQVSGLASLGYLVLWRAFTDREEMRWHDLSTIELVGTDEALAVAQFGRPSREWLEDGHVKLRFHRERGSRVWDIPELPGAPDFLRFLLDPIMEMG